MLRDNLVGLIEPMRNSAGADPLALSIQKQASDDRSICLENPRPEGAETSLTENVTSPFQAEPAQGSNPIAAILARISDEPLEYHLIFVPHANKGWRHDMPKGLKALSKGLHTIYAPDQILDLTLGTAQAANKKLIATGVPACVKVIVTCEVGREGFSWEECSRLHITSEDQTPVRVAQTLYRLFRKCEGKTQVVCCNYIPEFAAIDATKRESLTDRLNAVLALLLDEEMFFPISVEAQDSGTPKQPLREYFGESFDEMKADLLMAVEALPDLRKGLTEVLDAVMDSAGIQTEDRDRVRTALRRLAATFKATQDPKVMKAIRGMDARAMRTEAKFDIVVEDLHLNDIPVLTSQHMDAKTMIEYRAAIASISSLSQTTLPETVLLAEKLAKENGGPLPSYAWLTAHGHGRIKGTKKRHPEAFAHLEQESEQMELPETVRLAEKLAEENKENPGKLPPCSWLIPHGYANLSFAYRKHPKAFAHLEQVRLRNSLTQNVAGAEELAKNNGGPLPSYAWLTAHGHGRIVAAIQKDPEVFAHLQQVKLRKSLPEKVAAAEELAKANGDSVPSVKWLTANGHVYLVGSMTKYPKAFAHLKRDVLKRGGRIKGVRNLVNR